MHRKYTIYLWLLHHRCCGIGGGMMQSCSFILLYIITALNALCSLLTVRNYWNISFYYGSFLLFFSFTMHMHTIHTNTHVDLEVQHNKILVMATILWHFTAFLWLFSRIIIYWCFLYFSMSLFIKEFDYTVETVEYKQEVYQQNSTVQSIVCKYACIRSS